MWSAYLPKQTKIIQTYENSKVKISKTTNILYNHMKIQNGSEINDIMMHQHVYVSNTGQ